jgi:hypothetical protein
MKFLLSISLFVSAAASAQTDSRIFYSQLMVVFSDLDKNFEFLKGELQGKEGNDTLFETYLALEGTKENTILASPGGSAYQAVIIDSTSDEGSQLVLRAWKEKLTNALTGSFTELETEYRLEKDKEINGYRYSSEKIIVLLLRHKTDGGWYWINLVIKNK